MEAGINIDTFIAIAVPAMVLLIGAFGAVRLARSPGALKQRLLSALVALCLAVAATVSVLKIPKDQDVLRPGNPYPFGIGGLILEERGDGMIIDLFSR